MSFPVSAGVYTTESSASQTVVALGTTTGAIAGYFAWGPVFVPTLTASANALLQTFFKPQNWNYETWFTASNFLGYGSALYVTRTANTTPNTVGANLASNVSSQFPNNDFNAVAVPWSGYLNGNTPNAAVVLGSVILNNTDFTNKQSNNWFNGNSTVIARFPGYPGNSLRVGFAMSPTQYATPNLALSGTIVGGAANSNSYIGSITYVPGSNTANLVFSPTAGSNVAAGNAFATTFITSFFARGDLLQANTGNRVIPTQQLQLTNIGVATTNATNTVVQLKFASKYSGASNLSSNAVNRQWQYAKYFSVPNSWTSSYQSHSPASTVQDVVLGIVIDEQGFFSGTPNSVLETYNGLSRATDAVDGQGNGLYYKTVMNQNSQYVYVINDLPNAASNTANNLVNANNGATPWDASLQSGQSSALGEANAALGDLMNGYQTFVGKSLPVNLILAGKAVGGSATAGISNTTYNNFFMADWLINNLVNVRRDCVLFFSPDRAISVNNTGNEVTDIPNWAGLLTPSSYAVMDTGYKYQEDQFNNTFRWVPLNGDVAGTCVYTDKISFPWESPAGPNRGQIKNVTKLGYNPQEADRDVLYPLAINPVVTFPGQGTQLDGDRTFTQQPTAFNRINVRRLFIYMEVAIALAARYTLFELNNTFTQNQFLNMVNPFLQGIEASGGIETFTVICDGSNNTAQVRNGNQFLCAVYVTPAKSINFIRIDFISVDSGVAASSVENAAL